MSDLDPETVTNLNMDVAHPARIYDYILGGKDNFPADRAAAADALEGAPDLPNSMWANRRFMNRMATWITRELGIRQFLDIGTGLPTAPNLHECAQAVAPESRIIYVDNDPIVLVHARALLTSHPDGRTAYIAADMRDPEAILGNPTLTETLDLTKPVAVCLIAILHYIMDEDEARYIVNTLMQPFPAGSVLAISTGTRDSNSEQMTAASAAYKSHGTAVKSRTLAEVEALFEGLDLLDPGVVLVHRWHPDRKGPRYDDSQVWMYGGVAVKR